MKKWIALLCLVSAFNVFGQKEGLLRLYLIPPAESVSIDGTPLKSGNTISLKPGKYFVKAWSPNMALLDTILEVKAGETNNFVYRFEKGEAYLAHLAKMRAYNRVHARKFLLPLGTTALIGGGLVFTYLKGKQIEAEAEKQFQIYKYVSEDVAIRRKEFETTQERYRKYYTAQFIEYGALAVSSYFLIRGIRSLKDNPKPKLKKDRNPLTINQLGFAPNSFGGMGVGLQLNIN